MRTTNHHRISRRVGLTMAATFLLSLSAGSALAASPVAETTNPPSAVWTAAEAEQFLLTAEIIDSEPVPAHEGAARITLSGDGRTHTALVRTVDAYEYRWAPIRDSYRYNVAAYRLDKMLGLGAVPVTVERNVGGQMASVTWWTGNSNAPAGRAELAAFRQLVYAPDAANSNLPLDFSNADYTQAFAICGELPNARNLGPVSLDFHERLRNLDRRDLGRQLKSLLSKEEIHALWERRHEILESAHPLLTETAPVIRHDAPSR